MATTESLVAQIQGLSSNAVDLGNSVVVSDEIRGESLGVVWKTSIMQLVLDCNVFHESTQDYNEDGKLSFSEFSDLIKAFGNQKEELFKAADKNGDDAVSMDELAELPAFQQENEPLINCCPVCGEILEVSDKLNTLVHLSLCFDEGTGNQVMTGGLLINSLLMGMNLLTVNFMSCLLLWWMFKLSEWAHFSSYDVGLNSGSSASHILDSDSDFEVFELFDPAATGKVVGRISLSCSVEDPMETEKNFARCILAIVKEELFKAADKNGDDAVSMDELAELPAFQQENEPLINCCPVCGEILEVSDKLNTLVHLSLCFDEGTGNQVMTGGLLINSLLMGMNLLTVNFMSCLLLWWMFKLSEWAHFSSYDVGLNSGSSASHILVKETLLVAREGRVWCLEDRLVLGGFDWDPTLQEKACWSRRPFDRVCMPLDKWRGYTTYTSIEQLRLVDALIIFNITRNYRQDPMETEKNFARCILAIVDYNEDGKLSFSEFSDLIKAFGNQVADNKF
ncbi:hypothetical protein D5086_030531 [Populus alba]|uniref:Uncharacterized protein n=1 Tax=Populus alba TaxID=43335 RepID=A0ACC4ANT1_POPAL